MISVFRRTGDGESVVCRLSERNAKLTQECMGKDEVSVQVTVDEVLPIRVMDYIRVDGAVYTLNRMTDYDEVSDVEFRYQLIFEGAIYQLMDKMFVDLERNSDRFSLTATLREFTDLLVANINSVDSGWSAGDLPETERKNVTFESVSCREVLNRLASEFGVEYYLKDRQICFAERFENRTSLVFERGKGKGLYKLTCKNADTGNTVTRVRVYGSTENLPVGYRGGQADRLQLPMADGKPVYYLEDFSEFSKVVERTVHFEDVKPMFQGDVATVGDDFNRRITCPAIDFDLNAVAVGSDARVHFLTGELTGVSFEFEWDASKKELNLIRQEDQMALPDADEKRPLIPNETKKARVGDRFTFTGISLPQAYVDRAERELLAKGQEWLSFYKQLRVNFGLEVDYRFLRDSGHTLHVGDVVTVKVPKLGMEKMLRVLSVEKDLYSGKLSCNVSNYLTESWEKRIEGQIQATQGSVDRINLNASYLVEATRAWVAQRFARLAGGNRFVGKQEVDGDVELASDRKLSIGDAVVQVAKGLFRTVLSVAGKHGEDVEVEAAGLRAKQVTAEEVSSPDFVSGFLGSGARLKGSHLELDELTVRKRMNVYELMIEKVKSVGGNLIVSVGSAKIEAVTDEGDFFRCRVEAAGSGSERPFVVDDQVLCQTFGGDRVKRYWRRVVGTGDGFFDLSKTDCEAGSAAPEAGDEVVQLGHRSDRARQSAILLCAVGADAPYTDHYEGIDGFSLAGKLVSREGKLTGIVDDVFGELSGAGLYARNVYLRGSLALSTGQKVEERISELGQEQVLQKETLTEMKADQGGFSLRVSQVEEKAIAATDAVNGLQIGGVNYLNGSRLDSLQGWRAFGGTVQVVEDEKFGKVVEYSRPEGGGEFQKDFALPKAELSNTDLVYYVIAKKIDSNEQANWAFGGWNDTFFNLYAGTANKVDLGNGWYQYWSTFKNGDTVGNGTFGINSIGGTWRFYAAGVLKGNRPVAWSMSPDDQHAQADEVAQARIELLKTKELAELDGKITEAEQTAIDEAQKKLDALQIGTVNIFNHSGNFTDAVQNWYDNGGGLTIDSEVKYNGFNTIRTNVGSGISGDWYTLETGVEYCYSAMIKSDTAFDFDGDFVPLHFWGGVNGESRGKVHIIKSVQSVFANEWKLLYVVFELLDGADSFRPFVYINFGDRVFNIAFLCLTRGSKPLMSWSPSLLDQKTELNKGKLFVRGTGMNHSAMRCFILNNDSYNIASAGRGLNLVTINRNTLEIVDNHVYDTCSSLSDASNLVDKLNSLTSEVIVVLTSFDEVSANWTSGLTDAIERCGGTGIKPGYRVPYAFVGIPGIGKGRGLEVVTNAEANAPYAEITTQIINGVPVGMNATSSFLADQALGYIDSLTENKKIEWVDATGLDEEKYYPVILPLIGGKRATIRVETTLYESGVPSWAAHAQGFSCMCSWSVNGYGWGTISMDRLVSDFTYMLATELPIGDISQMTNSSIEYIYVRGGGKYRFVTTNVRSIELKTSDYTIQEQTIGIRNVVTAPVPNLDVVESKLQTQINQTADTIGFSAFKKDYNTDKVLINTKFGEIETSYDRVSATVSNIDGRLGNIETEKSGFLVKTDFVNVFSENLNELGQRVMSYINVSPDAIKISSSKIEISGQTVFRDTANNQTFSIFSSGGYALNLNNNFKVTTDGMLYATNAEISGKITSNSNGNRIVIDPESRSFQMLSSGGTAFFKLSFYDGGASMELKTSLDVAKQISQVTITPSFIDLTYYSYFISLGATSTTFRTERLTIDLSRHEGEEYSPKLYIMGLQKLTNTNGWDRLLVNVTTGEVAYG